MCPRSDSQPRVLRTGLAVGMAMAAVLSIGGAVGRATAVWSNPGHDPAAGTLTGYDRMAMELGTTLIGVDRGTERYREYEADILAFSGKYYTHRLATLLHVVPSALLFLLAPLQFVPGIRTRRPGVHRWSGRLILVLAIPVVVSGWFFGAMPFGGVAETIATGLAGGWFCVAAARAYVAIRRRDVMHHREWMIRMMAVILGIFTIRVVDLVVLRLVPISARTAFSPSVWIGWTLTILAAETWIRSTRYRPPSESRPSVSPDVA